MEKIKHLLSPGRSKDDEVLYGNGNSGGISANTDGRPELGGQPLQQGTPGKTTTLDRNQNKNTSSASEAIGSSTTRHHGTTDQFSRSEPEPTTTSTQHQTPTPNTSTGPTSTTQDFSSSRTNPGAATGAFNSNRDFNSAADDSLRPEPRTPASAASNASIKSNVIGKVPSGSAITYNLAQTGGLPPVPATGGKFMNDEALVGGSAGQTSGDRAFPLAGGVAGSTVTTHGPHVTETANRLDPNIRSVVGSGNASGVGSHAGTTTAQTTDNTPSRPTTSEDKHLGRDAALVGGLGSAAGIGAYEASKRHDQSRADPSGSTFSSGTTTRNTGPSATELSSTGQRSQSAASQAANVATSGQQTNPRHMPGAYPETPSVESEKTLGGNSTVTGGAAAIAAREAFKRHSPEQPTVGQNEANPYRSTLDPRVDSGSHNKRSGIASSTTQTTSGVPQGSLGEKIVEAEKKDHNYGKDVIVAGGAGAVGVGAYEAGKDRRQQDTLASTQTAQSPQGSTSAPYSGKPTPEGTLGEKINDAQAKEQHHGRDAVAVLGGTGVGIGAYEASKHHGHENNQGLGGQPGKNDMGAPGLAGTSPNTLGKAAEAKDERKETHHYGRDTALAGAGGAGVYEAAKHHNNKDVAQFPTSTDQSTTFSRPTGASQALAGSSTSVMANDPLASSTHSKALEGYSDQRAVPTPEAHRVGHEPAVGSQVIGNDNNHHYGRDATLIGGGTAAAAGGAHEYSKHHEDKLEKERERFAEQKHKEADKHGKEVRKHEEKERKHEEKERKHEEKEKKPGLISRILHHHKNKDATEEEHEPRRSSEKSRSSHDKHRNEAAVVGAGAAGASTAAHEHGKSDRNRLHKDPPTRYTSDGTRDGSGPGPEQYIGVHGTTGGSSNAHPGPNSGIGTHNVTEPHTGLPIDLSKGTGSGGTDGASQIGGYHTGADAQGTNWQDIKKANTPY